MPRPRKDRPHVPELLRHRPAQRARVRLNGDDHYLGPWPNDQDAPPPEAKAAYDRLIAEWLAGNRQPIRTAPSVTLAVAASQQPEPEGPSVAEMILAFWKHAAEHYRDPDGQPTGTLENYRHALRPLRELYGDMAAAAFGPLKLKALRQHLVLSGLCRGVVNARVDRVRRVFQWAVGEELIPETVYRALLAVRGLEKGRSAARETVPVGPVADAVVDATPPT